MLLRNDFVGSHMIGMVKDLLNTILNFVYPPRCLVCKKLLEENEGLCEDCFREIEAIKKPYCQKCGKPLESSGTFHGVERPICLDCRKGRQSFAKARAIGRYEGVLRECIHLFKYKGKKVLLKPLGRLVESHLDSLFPWESISFIVPVPLHRKRRRERGFNQAELAGKLAGSRYRILVLPHVLERVVYTSPQVRLNKKERLKNVKGVFAVRKNSWVRRSTILLVDDVYTTGATLNECARVLKKAGADTVYVLTLAHGS